MSLTNRFINAAQKGDTFTENGAVSNSTTGNYILDYFSKAGTYQGRTQKEVDHDMVKIFSENEQSALKMVFGLRNITRKTTGQFKNGRKKISVKCETTQTGYGRRDEFYKAIVWLNENKPELLEKNIHLIPIFGSWKDLFSQPLIETIDRKLILKLVKENWDNDLLKKFLPTFRSKTRSERDKLRVQLAKDIMKHMKISHKDYRKHKTSGLAHIWQKQMGNQEWDSINFNGIPGKAMNIHVNRKGKDGKTVFERHNQDKRLLEWAKKQSSVKFNGYPYELVQSAQKAGGNIVKKVVIDKQFQDLLEKCGNHQLGNVLACLDTSGSMSWGHNNGATALDIGLSMGLVFSNLNTGHFKNHVIGFSDRSELIRIPKTDFCGQYEFLTKHCWMGSTNFQSVIDLLVKIRKENPDIPLEDYPSTLLVVSDMQFNGMVGTRTTNHDAARKKLDEVGLKNIRFIWWDVTGRCSDFPSKMDDPGVYQISGFDPNNLFSLLGIHQKEKVNTDRTKENPMDGLNNFLSQEIFELLKF